MYIQNEHDLCDGWLTFDSEMTSNKQINYS